MFYSDTETTVVRRPGGGLRRHAKKVVLALALILVSAACDSLLEVELPGNLIATDLADPKLARTLALGVQADFECTYDNFIMSMTLWTTEGNKVDNGRPTIETNLRVKEHWDTRWGNGSCTEPRHTYMGFHIARAGADLAQELIPQFDDADVDANTKNFLLGHTEVYEGWATQLLGEEYCEVTFDQGAPISREATYQRALDAFTDAAGHLAGVTGPDAAQARNLWNAAMTGKARANLALGNLGLVEADASQVDVDFIFWATYAISPDRRRNDYWEEFNEDLGASLSEFYVPTNHGNNGLPNDPNNTSGVDPNFTFLHAFLADGVTPDPRVPVFHDGEAVGFDNFSDVWTQRKYPDVDSPMRITSWREAQLMIAEVNPSLTVGIINNLRADWLGLPVYAGGTAAEIAAQLRVERIKELFMDGTRMIDKIRWNEPWNILLNPRGEPYNPNVTGCVPLGQFETGTNPNF